VKLSLPEMVSIVYLPTSALGVVTVTAWAAGLPALFALVAGGASALALSLLGREWVAAFRSRNPRASRKDEKQYSLLVCGLYLLALVLAFLAFGSVARLIAGTGKKVLIPASLLLFFFAGGLVFRLSHKPLSARSTFRRGRRLLAHIAAKMFVARWADSAQLQVPLGGLLLPRKAATSHTAFIGAPESGKSLSIRLMAQKALPLVGLGLGHRALVYAAKREDLPFMAAMNLNAPVYLLHPFDLRGSAWDVAEISDPATARELATALIPEEQGQNRYFIDCARELLYGIIRAFMLMAPGRWDLRDVILCQRSEARLKEVLGKSPETRHLIELHFEPRSTFQNIRSTLATRLEIFEPAAACWHRAETKVRFRDWVETESIVILGNDPKRRASIHPINRVILKWVTQLLLAKPNTDTERSSIWLDELPDLGKVESLLELLGEGRSKGVAAFLGTQSIDALYAIYGKDLAEAILATVSHLGLLRSAGAVTATWQADRLGDYEFDETNVTVTSQAGGGASVACARHVANRKAVMSSEFLSLPATNPENGLTGFYVSSFVGAWKSHLPGEYLSRELLPPDPSVPDFVPRPEDHEVLLPWTVEDFRRLGLDEDPPIQPFTIKPQGKNPPKLPSNRGAKR
jgi:hypothetical protein